MTTVAKLSADLSANTSKFEAGLAKANSALSRSKNQWQRDTSAMAGGFGAIGKAAKFFGVSLGLATLTQFGRMAVATADELQNLSERTGASAAFFSSLQADVENAGGSISGLGKSLSVMQTLISQAGRGVSSAAEKFKSLGLSIDDLKNMSPEEQFYTISEALSRLSSQYERTEAARAIFGKGAIALMPILNQGGDALREMVEQQEALGNALTNEQVARIDQFGDSINSMATAIKNNLIGAFAELLMKIDEFYYKYREAQRMRGINPDRPGPKNIGASLTFAAGLGNSGEASAARRQQAKADAYARDAAARGFVTSATNGSVGVNLQKEYESRYGAVQSGRALSNDAATKAATKERDLIEGIIGSLSKQNDTLMVQVDMYGQKQSAIDAAVKMAEIENQISEAGITLTKEQRAEIERKLELFEELSQRNDEQLAQTKKIEEAERNRQQALTQLAYTVESSFEDAIINGKELSDVIAALAQDIARLALRAALAGPISGMGGFFGDFFGGFFAAGGTPPVGKYSVVGERGPEIIAPSSAMKVIPNHAMGGGGNFYAEINVTTQGGGAGGDGKQIAGAIQKQLDTWFDTKIQSASRPGGTLNPVF